jgi:transcriptional regulator with PAS, ATPase and Fis domain
MRSSVIQTPAWLRQIEGILEELNEGVIIVDEQLRMIFVNEALIRLGRYERGELQGRNPMPFFRRKTSLTSCGSMNWASAMAVIAMSSTFPERVAKKSQRSSAGVVDRIVSVDAPATTMSEQVSVELLEARRAERNYLLLRDPAYVEANRA